MGAGAGLAIALPACSDQEAAVRSTAERFYAAVERGDGQAACEELSEDTVDQLEQSEGADCEQAATELELSGSRARDVQVFSDSGMVDFDGGDRVFLTQEPDGWKISAAGCRIDEDADEVPHECSVES
jgi:hypothetical protein